jgi:hypothetical protein
MLLVLTVRASSPPSRPQPVLQPASNRLRSRLGRCDRPVRTTPSYAPVGDDGQRPPGSPGHLWCRREIDPHPKHAHPAVTAIRPVQRLGASRVAHRLPLNACRTRHLDGTPHRFWPHAAPSGPAWARRLRQPQNSLGTNPFTSSEPPVQRAGRSCRQVGQNERERRVVARWSGLRRSSVVGAVDGVGCGEADGVAIAVMAVGDVDELVAQPQAEAGPGAGAVQGGPVEGARQEGRWARARCRSR